MRAEHISTFQRHQKILTSKSICVESLTFYPLAFFVFVSFIFHFLSTAGAVAAHSSNTYSYLPSVRAQCSNMNMIQNFVSEKAEKIFVGYLAQCSHTYHFKCVWQWLEYHDHCPLCRKQVSDNLSISFFLWIHCLGTHKQAEICEQ